MPMNERRYDNTPDFKYGDGFINQFYYIATLAMEEYLGMLVLQKKNGKII